MRARRCGGSSIVVNSGGRRGSTPAQLGALCWGFHHNPATWRPHTPSTPSGPAPTCILLQVCAGDAKAALAIWGVNLWGGEEGGGWRRGHRVEASSGEYLCGRAGAVRIYAARCPGAGAPYLNEAAAAEGLVILADLVALWQVRVEVLLAVKL